MAFDSFSLYRLMDELRPLVGERVRAVLQPDDHEIVLRIGPYNLLISAHPVHARAHLIPKPPKVKERRHFSDFLLTHLGRGTVTDIRQIGLDRILHIEVKPAGEFLEPEPKVLICEFMGKHSNIILVEKSSGRILESIKHIDSSLSRYREVLPGREYIPPPSRDKLNPFEIGREELIELLSSRDEVWRAILEGVEGFSPALAREVEFRAGSPDPEAVWEAFREVIEAIREGVGDGRPCVMMGEDGRPVAVAPIRLRSLEPVAEPVFFDTMSEALDAFHRERIEYERFLSSKAALIRRLKRWRDSLAEKLKKLEEELEKAEDYEILRIKGELILANLNRIRKGDTRALLINYYDPNLRMIEVELSPELSPAANAQAYFKRYAKAKRARAKLSSVIADHKKTVEILEEFIERAEAAGSMEELKRVKEELRKEGWAVEEEKGAKRKEKEPRPFKRFVSSDGFEILVGRNDRENDLLTMKFASKNDVWLHVKGMAGSHVVIRNPENRDVPMSTLLEAARIAAYFSKARNSSNVPVDYTLVKYVTKPQGAKSGFVIYRNERTIFVNPALPPQERGEAEL